VARFQGMRAFGAQFVDNYRTMRSLAQSAKAGKATSGQVAAAKPMSSGRMQSIRNSRVAQSVTRHPYRAGAAGVAGLGAASYVTGSSRRGRGVDKTQSGRPTGIYKY